MEETPLHAHSFIEIAFVEEGEGVHLVGTREYPCKKGEVYIINHDVPHRFKADNGSTLIICNCIFQLNFMDYTLLNSKIFYDMTYPFLLGILSGADNISSPKALMEDNAAVLSLYKEMLSEYTLKKEGYINLLKADLMRLLVFFFRAYRKGNDTVIAYDSNPLLQKAIEYIHSNYYKEITVEELSLQAFLSQSHFCRLFKKYSGITVKEFIQKIRIKEACRLLKSTDKKIPDVACEVGYNDLKHFNALFKKLTGTTPNEYRKTGAAST